MVTGKKFPRPTVVFLDGDQSDSKGCVILPGGDAPERVVFTALAEDGFLDLAQRVGRSHSKVVDACQKAMTADDHHEWIGLAADELLLGGQNLWQALCAIWAEKKLPDQAVISIVDSIRETLM
jgi:hypothetical protein